MEETGKEELRLTQEIGDVDADNNGLITIIAEPVRRDRTKSTSSSCRTVVVITSIKAINTNIINLIFLACSTGAKTGKLL